MQSPPQIWVTLQSNGLHVVTQRPMETGTAIWSCTFWKPWPSGLARRGENSGRSHPGTKKPLAQKLKLLLLLPTHRSELLREDVGGGGGCSRKHSSRGLGGREERASRRAGPVRLCSNAPDSHCLKPVSGWCGPCEVKVIKGDPEMGEALSIKD